MHRIARRLPRASNISRKTLRRRLAWLSQAAGLESLEGRRLLSTYSVTDAASLESAIAHVDAGSGGDTIQFTSSGPLTIVLTSPLQPITEAVTIDGTTEGGYAGTPLVNIEAGAGAGATGLDLQAKATVKGLIIGGFSGDGILVDAGGAGSVIENNYIGTDTTGANANSNGQGVVVDDTGVSVKDNVISGNNTDGILVEADDATITGNFIGTDSTGMNAVSNGGTGITINGAAGVTVSGNIISGNLGNAVEFDLSNGATSVVQGNYIGVDASGENGSGAMGNGGDGVSLFQSSGITIGGTGPGDANVISNNVGNGVHLYQSSSNLIEGNLIGTDASGEAMMGNFGSGVYIGDTINGYGNGPIDTASGGNTIGGASAAARNVISNNNGDGVTIDTSDPTSNTVQGNYIGVDATGEAAMGNTDNGISVISGAATITGNVVSANYGGGVELQGSGVLTGNFIGTGADGASNLGNFGDGVYIFGSSGNTVGTTANGGGNTIAFNTGDGVDIYTQPPGENIDNAIDNSIRGNSIYANGLLGIDLGGTGVVVPNDSQGHVGPNEYQNFPVISGIVNSGSSITITGTLNAAADGTFALDFFSNTDADPSGNGQGQTYLGSTSVTTDGAGHATFSVTLAEPPAGQNVMSATATDAAGDTSEFGADAVVPVHAGLIGTTTTLNTSPNPSTYGQMVTFTATVSAGTGSVTFMDGDTVLGSATISGDTATLTTSALTAGTHTITAVYGGDSDYVGSTSGPMSQVVDQAALTITIADQTKVYGQADPTLTDSFSGFVNGDTSASLTTQATLSVLSESANVGDYTISGSGASDSNYSISYVNGTLSITPASLTITANDQTKVYGQSDPTLTDCFSGFVNGDTSASLWGQPTLSVLSESANVGSYTIQASGAVDGNYSISYVNGSLSVTQASLIITANNQTKVYGQSDPTLTDSFSGFVNGDTASSLTSQPTLSVLSESANVGSYTIQAGGAVDSNYSISYVNGTLSVTQASLIITANNQTKVYGQSDPTLTDSFSGFVNGDTASSLSTQPTLSVLSESANVGTYTIAASGAVDSNYCISYVNGSLSVTQASLTITANNQTKVYGQSDPTLTDSFSGFVNGDTASSLSTQPTLSVLSESANVGTYTIAASGAVDGNYCISYVNGSLSVTQASLIITANNQTKVYGQSDPTLTDSFSGFVNGDTASSLSTQPTLSVLSESANVGTYTIAASGAVDGNYCISYVNGSLSITPASLTITANNQTKVYGQSDPTLTDSFSGFVNGDTASSLTAQPMLSVLSESANVGTYTIAASGAVDGNYCISYVNGSLSVTQAHLTITANNQTKVYGQANPTLTDSFSGFVNGDTAASLTTQPTLSIVGESASSPVGTYTITASGAVDGNYSISYVNGSLSVTQAPLIITACNQTKVYGQSDPTLTDSFSGFVNGDTSASLSTQPTLSVLSESANVGTYTIKALGAVDGNYSISYVNGSLSVTPAHLTITANNQTKVYGAANPTLTATYSGLVNGDTSAADPVTLSTVAANSAVGTYTITVSGAADANYTPTYVNGSLSITQDATTTSLGSSANPSYTGQSVTFTATIAANSPGSGTPTGSVIFKDGSTVLGTVTLSGGTATLTTSALAVATHSITAVYSGDTNFVTSTSAPLSQVVQLYSTSTTVASSLNPSSSGQSVTFTATVSGTGSPTGTVTFKDGSTVLGTGTLSGGKATYTTSALAVGTQSITAVYGGDTHNAASTSAALSQVVNPLPSTISGKVYKDLTGNGMSSDDTLMAGVTVELFLDKDNGSALDSADGGPVATAVSSSTGAYSFSGLAAGTYFVEEVVPTGYVQTQPVYEVYYTNAVSNGTAVTNDNFDNYQTCNCASDLSSYYFLINGTTKVTDLRGNTQQGETVEVVFTVMAGDTATYSLASYYAPDNYFNASDAYEQAVYQSATGTFGPGTHTLTVKLPSCDYQVDFMCGPVITQLGPAGSNIFYSAENRLISADNGGTVAPASSLLQSANPLWQ